MPSSVIDASIPLEFYPPAMPLLLIESLPPLKLAPFS